MRLLTGKSVKADIQLQLQLQHMYPLTPRLQAVLIPPLTACRIPSLSPTPLRTLKTFKPATSHPLPWTRALSTSPSMSADNSIPPPSKELDAIESAKRKAAFRAVQDHFRSEYRFVGIGSGSTIVYGVEAIKHYLSTNPPPQGHMNWFVPTGWNSRKVIEEAGLVPIAFDSLPGDAMLDVCFDGADEVDAELNCIKGGGACLFQEKLVATRSKRFICIADYRKQQARLLTNWPSIPIEVAPIGHASVLRELELLGSKKPKIREHSLAKTGPIQTDQSFYIIDAPFEKLLTPNDVKNGKDGSGKNGSWEVSVLADRIKRITGVLEVGLFYGMDGDEAQAAGMKGGQKPVACYFGTADGEVTVQDNTSKK